MAGFSRDEVEAAFRVYWQTGVVGEEWDAWSDLLTEDALHLEHILGRRQGREKIRKCIEPTMQDYWEPAEAMAATKRYQGACAAHDPQHPQRRSSLHWPTDPSWAARQPAREARA